MKKVMFALLAMLGSAVVVNAQDTTQVEDQPSTGIVSPGEGSQADDKVQIKPEELPEAVKKTLEDQEYKGWLINTAYHDKKAERYEVELKNGADTQVIRFSKEGERLDD